MDEWALLRRDIARKYLLLMRGATMAVTSLFSTMVHRTNFNPWGFGLTFLMAMAMKTPIPQIEGFVNQELRAKRFYMLVELEGYKAQLKE